MELNSLQKDRKKKRASVDLSTMVYGRVPPHAVDMEKAVLGAMIEAKLHNNYQTIDDVSGIVQAECFYVEAHQMIFRAIEHLHGKGLSVDDKMVINELKSRDQLETVGGFYEIVKLAEGVVTLAHVEDHCRIIKQKFIQREVIRVCGEFIGEAYEDSTDVFDMVDSFENAVDKISNGSSVDKVFTMVNQCIDFVQEYDRRRASDDQIFGVSSGFASIDDVTNGWQPTDLVCLAAFSGVGKTAFALNLAKNAAKSGSPTGFFCLEMLNAQLTQRIVSSESEVPLKKIKRGTADVHEDLLVKKALAKLEKLNLYLDDSTYTLPELKRKIRRLVKKFGVKLVIIDYYQLIQLGGDIRGMNREQQLAQISRELKKEAKELGITIIVLSQVGEKEIVKRQNVEPKQSDLRESQALGNDSDLIIMLYRPGYHEIEADENGNSTAGETFAKIVKHRNGSLAKVKLISKLHIQKFMDPSQDVPTGLPNHFVPVPTEEEFPFGKPNPKK